jgi:hypothetical protein
MAFDDLARHMAARDKKKLATAKSARQIVAEAAESDRRMARQRDLILGMLLLAIGIAGCVFAILLANAKPSPRDLANFDAGEFRTARRYAYALAALALGALAAGARQTYRALRNRSHLESGDDLAPAAWVRRRG